MPNDDEKIWLAYTKGVKRIRRDSKEKNITIKKDGLVPRPLGAGLGVGYIKTEISNPPPAKTKGLLSSKPKFLQPPPQGGRGSLQFDRTTERKFREGTIKIDARIDLHGMTQAEAHAALGKFTAKQAKAGHRNLLIITGKGKDKQGVLRTNLPGWLDDLPEAGSIIALREAAIRHGGAGAFYVILKRRKDKDVE